MDYAFAKTQSPLVGILPGLVWANMFRWWFSVALLESEHTRFVYYESDVDAGMVSPHLASSCSPQDELQGV